MNAVANGPVDQNIALPWHQQGMSVVPIRADGTKRPTMDWRGLQRERFTPQEVQQRWSPGSTVGVAVICGAISGNLEMTELEGAAYNATTLAAIEAECESRGVSEVWRTLLNGYQEKTPGGGLHLLYRVADHPVPGNTKLAIRKANKSELTSEEREVLRQFPTRVFIRTLAETRGEGGYVIVAPTGGNCHPSKKPWQAVAGTPATIPTISWNDRSAIHAAIHAVLDETPDAPPPPLLPPALPSQALAPRIDTRPQGMRPGDAWEETVSWNDSWFTGQGWKVFQQTSGGETFWTRPGKDRRDGHSATTGYRQGKDCLYVFSTSAGLPVETPLSKFFVYAHYYHGGDMKAAASELARQGFGDAPQQLRTEIRVWADGPDVPAIGTPTHDGLGSPPPAHGMDQTDMGNGERLKQAFGHQFRYCTSTKVWYAFRDGVWYPDQHFAVMRAAMWVAENNHQRACQYLDEAMKEAESATGEDALKAAKVVKRAEKMLATAQNNKNLPRLNASLVLFAAQEGIAITSEQFDCESRLLNLPNGTWDLISGQVMPHEPQELLSKRMGAAYDPEATCPKFEGFMLAAFPDAPIRAYVQRALGYSLLGNPTDRVMFFLHGPSGTGKSVLTGLMARIFGDYGITAPASTFRLKQQSDSTLDLHRLKGARFVATSELPEGSALDEELIKRITGNDAVSTRGHYEGFSEWRSQCVVWIATNYLPRINADDDAIWRRSKTIPMLTRFVGEGEIGDYGSILYREEASGILNWLLVGLAEYQRIGLSEPAEITSDVEAYRQDVNTVATFLSDMEEEGALLRDENEQITSAALRGLYELWCKQNGIRQLGPRRFAHKLRGLGCEPVKVGGVARWKGLRHNANGGVLNTWGS